MKPLSPKAILIAGPVGIFVAAMIPTLWLAPWGMGLAYLALGHFLLAVFLGIPIFSVIAWGSSWWFRKPDEGNPYDLDRRYRFIERNLAMCGMGALGFLAGCAMTHQSIYGDQSFSSLLGIITIILVLTCMLVVMFVALVKPGLMERIQFLQNEITRLRKEQQSTEMSS
jgi:hypothetical protein